MWSASEIDDWIIEEFFGMYRLYYTPIQPTLPCSFELTSEHEGSLPFNEIHAVVCLRNQPYSVFNEITLDTMNDERKFVVCAVHCRRDADGCLKATISLPKFPPGQQRNEHGAQELQLSLITGLLEPLRTLTSLASFPISLCVIPTSSTLVSTTRATVVRYDSKDASMVEENPLVVLPGKVYGKVYMNIDKPPPTVLTEGVVIGVGVEIGLGLGMGMEGDYSHVFEVDSHVDLPVKK